MAPSLAVDLRVLKFIRLLFIRQSPNQTAWCDILETFLDGMRYKLTSKNSLRCRFSNVFHWYRVLTVLARDHVSTLITDARKDHSHVDQPMPTLFGGNDWPDVIVCIDVCFTQNVLQIPAVPPAAILLARQLSRRKTSNKVEPDKDCYEEGMRVPVLVLNGCGESFIAADKKHDRVLWIVNLTSAGETQHYVLALLDRFF
ncbi:hypothetical protein DFJ58DRAFT_716921 [Suillus subalutaceus]|uniref:uncharacterized protein n=1 Tax=Suillus subalutaceus TaxID=48586 RepID=UPI001B86983A|nr:uncharacterized protein DFJ58DRAFT_716921 [Suillus subalutaceus]KAG1849435.1 hypothetical protein DFJ58DRAFT_716921 [Suillus subalutaceus]